MPDGPAHHDPFGLLAGTDETITGTVVCAAVIAYAGGRADSLLWLCLAIFGTVGVYWLAHLHAVTIALTMQHRHHPVQAVEHAMQETWPIAGSALLPVAVLIVSSLLGAEVQTAAWIALAATIALLAVYSFVAAMRADLGTWGRIASAAVGAGLGILVALLKVSLH